MKVFDLHIHTRLESTDSIIDPDELVMVAKRKGLDGLCLTEHGVTKSSIAPTLAKKYDFVVLGGFEASTELGDVLIFGLDSIPRNIYKASEIKPLVEKAGGVMIAAHPFRSDFNRARIINHAPVLDLVEACHRKIFSLVDAMEVANGWTVEEDVNFCRQVSQNLGLKGTGGSDAHMISQVGCCVTIFSNGVEDEESFIRELKKGNFWAEDRRAREQKNPAYWCL